MESDDLMGSLFETMGQGTPADKFAILETIREKGDVSLISPLVKFLEEEKSRAVKDRILIVLDVLVPLSGYRNVDRMLRSPDPQVRNGIVEIIRRSDIPIINFLEKLSEDKDKDVRKFVIDSLSSEKSEKAIEIIRRRLRDPDINIVYTAIEYLGNFKDRESVDTIETLLLETDNLMVMCAGLEALARIGDSPRKETIMETFMKDPHNFMINFPLLRYIGAFGSPNSFSYIEVLIKSNPGTFTKEIIDAVEGIMQNNRLESLPRSMRKKLEAMAETVTNTVDKYAIAKLLARAGGSRSDQLQKARKMLDDPNPMIKLCGIELLADTGEAEDIQRLEDIAEHTDNDELLEAIGDAVMKIEERTGE